VAVADAQARTEQHPQYPGLDPAMMGMYIFLASEVMFFGSLFAMYFYLFGSHPFSWPPPNTVPVNWWPIPFFNTIILLSSGLTCHFALDSIAHDNRRNFYILLIATIILGVLFESGQVYEFTHAHLQFFNSQNQFATAFFTMTGFHGAHVAGGLVLLLLMLWRATKGHFNSRHHVGFAAATLYWHFVDVVWVFLFGILYLAVTAVG
jgi:cytochrome c oxidase subunit 3